MANFSTMLYNIVSVLITWWLLSVTAESIQQVISNRIIPTYNIYNETGSSWPQKSEDSENINSYVHWYNDIYFDDNETMLNMTDDECHSQIVNTHPDMGDKAAQLLYMLQIPSFALVPQCNTGRSVNDVINKTWLRGISSCTLSNMLTLTEVIMTKPNDGYCFGRRLWTVVLLGSNIWTLHSLTFNNTLYTQRIHWVVIVEGTEPVSSYLSQLSITHRITWLRWSSQIKAIIRTTSIGRCYYLPTGETECTGYVGKMLMLLAKNLNMTIINNPVRYCGVANQNGSRVAVIQQGSADIALGTCSITANRLQAVDFTEFFKVIRSTIGTGRPKLVISPFIIFNVLSWQTWLCLGIYVMFVSLMAWITGKILAPVYPYFYYPPQQAIAVTTKAMVFQAHRHQPRSVSGRAVLSVSWAVLITLIGVYSGNLTAWLSIPRFEKPVNTLSDLIDRPDIKPAVARNDPNHMMFVNRTEGLLGAIASRLVFRQIYTNKELINKMAQGEVAYFNSVRSHIVKATRLNTDDGLIGRLNPCQIHIGTQDLLQNYLGLMINKNSWFKEQINERIRWLRSFGIVEHLYRQFNKPGCILVVRRSVQGGGVLSLRQLQGAFWVMLSGIVLATVVFALEMSCTIGNGD